MRSLLYTIAVVMVLIWIVEFFFYQAGILIHGLLAIAVLLTVIGFAQGKKITE